MCAQGWTNGACSRLLFSPWSTLKQRRPRVQLGGLLNATFGNAVEAIVGIIALFKGELRIVQTSMLGSILSNILLVLGCAFLAAGFYFKESNFQVTAAQTSGSLMVLACATLIIPAAYHAGQVSNGGLPSIAGAGTGSLQTLISGAFEAAQNDPSEGMPKDIAQLLTISRGTAIVSPAPLVS